MADPEVIISVIDGKPYKALRRHLATRGLTPETYRERYGLKADYSMVAPNYSKRRAEAAKVSGLRRKHAGPSEAAADEAAASEPAPAPKAKRPARARVKTGV